jgi:multisubunit Na+/H+ antiporter MnhG subunit
MLKKQDEYNSKQLFWSRSVAITAVLALLAALGIVKFHPDAFAKNFGTSAAKSTTKRSSVDFRSCLS